MVDSENGWVVPGLNNLWEWDGHTSNVIISTSSLVDQQLSDAQVREEYAKLQKKYAKLLEQHDQIKIVNEELRRANEELIRNIEEIIVSLQDWSLKIEKLNVLLDQEFFDKLRLIEQIQQLEAQQELEPLRAKVAELTQKLRDATQQSNAERSSLIAEKNIQVFQLEKLVAKLHNIESIVWNRPQLQGFFQRSVPTDRYISFIKELLDALKAQ